MGGKPGSRSAGTDALQRVLDDLAGHESPQARFIRDALALVVAQRDALGLPAGATSLPYWICSNDLCAKFAGVVELFREREVALPIATLHRLLVSLLASYEGGHDGWYHSLPKADVEALVHKTGARGA